MSNIVGSAVQDHVSRQILRRMALERWENEGGSVQAGGIDSRGDAERVAAEAGSRSRDATVTCGGRTDRDQIIF